MANTPTPKTYKGRCHCGDVKLSVTLPSLEEGYPVTVCNCSICFKKGNLLIFPLQKDVIWHSGYDDLRTYSFSTLTLEHLFCNTCGVSIGGRSTRPEVLTDRVAFSARIIDDADDFVDALTIKKQNGKGTPPAYNISA